MLAFKNRFHGHNSLRYVYKNNRTVRSQTVVLKCVRNPKRNNPRFAAVISKKTIKSAVGRNRVRRRVYEIIRKHLHQIDSNCDVVLLIVNAEARTMPAKELEDTVLDVLTRAGIYKNTGETGIL